VEPEQQVLDAVGSGRIEEVARLWVRGNSIPWARLATGRAARRMGGLPTYPFARERYWIKSSGPSAQ
jgi:acyl transferase domain-containing protein